jgi:hypothetical protein
VIPHALHRRCFRSCYCPCLLSLAFSQQRESSTPVDPGFRLTLLSSSDDAKLSSSRNSGCRVHDFWSRTLNPKPETLNSGCRVHDFWSRVLSVRRPSLGSQDFHSFHGRGFLGLGFRVHGRGFLGLCTFDHRRFRSS